VIVIGEGRRAVAEVDKTTAVKLIVRGEGRRVVVDDEETTAIRGPIMSVRDDNTSIKELTARE
jgi:hypothetical protein